MFIEKRKHGKKTKYYLVHTYRLGDKVKRISRYLGSNIKQKSLEKLRERAEQLILEQVKESSILEGELTKEEIEFYKKYEKKIKISHLDWKQFTQSFVYNTNAIEGSTVSQSEVKRLLNKEEKPVNSDELESMDVAEAVDYIRKTKEKPSINLILKLHQICFRRTKSFAGKLRDVEVIIRDRTGNIVHRGAPSKDVKKLLEKLCKWYGKHKDRYPALLLASVMHNQFEKIHPFQDGNGRVGRLLLNYLLLRHKYPVVNIRFKDRRRYYKCLQIFDKKEDIKPTLRFLIDQYRK